MSVGTERRVLGFFPIPFIKTFEPLRRTVETHPVAFRREVVEDTDGFLGNVVYKPEAWVHPIIESGKPTGISVDQGYRLGDMRMGNRSVHNYDGENVNGVPLRLRRLRHTNPIIPEVIVYRRS